MNVYFFWVPVHTWIRLDSECLCAVSHAVHTAITAWAVRLDKKLHALPVAHIPALYSQFKRSHCAPGSVLTAGLSVLWKWKCSLSLSEGSRWRPLTMSCSRAYKYLVLACVGIPVITFTHTLLMTVQAVRAGRKGTGFLSLIHPSFLPRKKRQLRD